MYFSVAIQKITGVVLTPDEASSLRYECDGLVFELDDKSSSDGLMVTGIVPARNWLNRVLGLGRPRKSRQRTVRVWSHQGLLDFLEGYIPARPGSHYCDYCP